MYNVPIPKPTKNIDYLTKIVPLYYISPYLWALTVIGDTNTKYYIILLYEWSYKNRSIIGPQSSNYMLLVVVSNLHYFEIVITRMTRTKWRRSDF